MAIEGRYEAFLPQMSTPLHPGWELILPCIVCICYSLSQITMFYYGAVVANTNYILFDVVSVVTLTYAITCALPNDTLKARRPSASLFSPYTLGSVLGNLGINAFVFAFVNIMVPLYSGYLRWPLALVTSNLFWLLGERSRTAGPVSLVFSEPQTRPLYEREHPTDVTMSLPALMLRINMRI